MSARRILTGIDPTSEDCWGEKSRILVLSKDECSLGIIVEEVSTIETIAEDEIMPLGSCKNSAVSGIYQKSEGHNIMLLNMENLVCNRMDELKAMGRLAVGLKKTKPACLIRQSDPSIFLPKTAILFLASVKIWRFS